MCELPTEKPWCRVFVNRPTSVSTTASDCVPRALLLVEPRLPEKCGELNGRPRCWGRPLAAHPRRLDDVGDLPTRQQYLLYRRWWNSQVVLRTSCQGKTRQFPSLLTKKKIFCLTPLLINLFDSFCHESEWLLTTSDFNTLHFHPKWRTQIKLHMEYVCFRLGVSLQMFLLCKIFSWQNWSYGALCH